MAKILTKLATICFLAIFCIGFTTCGDKDKEGEELLNSVQGTWKGVRTDINPVSGRKYVYLSVHFSQDMTGYLEYETPTGNSEAFFSYSISGNTINCSGVYFYSDGDYNDNYSINFKAEGDRLITDSNGGFILTRDGSVIVDSDGNEVTDLNAHVTPPSFDKYITTSEFDGFTIRARFNNGGDSYENMSCMVYWRAYSSKPSKTPTKEDMTNCESMRIYDHSTKKTVFEKAHVGYAGGTYIYYYTECYNCKGSCTSDLTFTVIPRL